MLKNLFKATTFYYVTHKCRHNFKCLLNKGWLASLKDYKVLLEKLFQHICPPKQENVLQLVGIFKGKGVSCKHQESIERKRIVM